MASYIYPPYSKKEIAISDLQLGRALEILRAINNHDFCDIIECGIFESGNEFLIVDLQIERGQFVKNDIRSVERVLIEVLKDDRNLPYVFSMREDFPSSVPHLNIQPFELPKCLCLYDQSPDEVKISWTGFMFLETIRNWLKLTAEGTLHQEDQSLEPFFIESIGNIILPYPINQDKVLSVWLRDFKEGAFYNFVSSYESIEKQPEGENRYHLLQLWASEVVHGAVRRVPTNFSDLAGVLKELNLNLVEEIDILCNQQSIRKKRLLILLFIPTKRHEDGKGEFVGKFAFMFMNTIEDIAKSIGVLILNPVNGTYISALQTFINNEDKTKYIQETHEKGSDIPAFVIKPHFNYNKIISRHLNDVGYSGFNICQIGAGAIGSQVFMNLARSGFGDRYYLFDDDTFLPHNAARHSLTSLHLGQFKSNALTMEANILLNQHDYSFGINENINVHNLSNESLQILKSANILVDTSASQATARFLCNIKDVEAKRVSAFLNPSGSDLIILAEDSKREITLNQLEMLYYSEIVNNSVLSNHLLRNKSQLRYANTCRDISFVMPNEYVSIHAGIATKAIKELVESNNSFAGIWRISKTNLGIEYINIHISKFSIFKINDWNVAISEILVSKLSSERQKKLPKETGGILIGSFDMVTREIYIIDSIFSPDDSFEYPTAYIRGIKGVREKIEEVENVTIKNLTYIGEWHSHPKNCSIEQSKDDLILFKWINDFMQPRGLPGLMVIVGDSQLGVYVG